MPYLGDYLGHLMSEITIARMQADLEAVRVAELYASHPLLRTMPVPHFRLPDIDMDVPVVIKQVQEASSSTSARGGASVADLRKTFDQVIAARAVRLTADQKRKLSVALDARAAALTLPTETSVDVNRVADDFAANAARILAEGDEARKLETELKAASRVEFLKQRQAPARLMVLATTQEVREAATSDSVTRIHLKISEQAVEWTTIEGEGGPSDRLVPE